MEKEKFVVKRLVLNDGTLPRPEDIVGYYTPVAVLGLRPEKRVRKVDPLPKQRTNRLCILVFKDFSDPVGGYLFAQVDRRAFMRCIRDRNRMDWLEKVGGGSRRKVVYTGYNEPFSDDQKSACFEFTYLF